MMEVLFESRRDTLRVQGKVHTDQHQPAVSPEPVLVPDGAADEAGTSIYGSILVPG